MSELTPTQRYAVELALKDFFERPGELSVDVLVRTLDQNGLAIATKGSLDAEFARGVNYVSELAEGDADPKTTMNIGRLRRNGLEAPEYSFTVEEIGQLVEGVLESG